MTANNNINIENVKKHSEILDIPPKLTLVWPNIIWYIYLHTSALFGLILIAKGKVLWETVLWCAFLCVVSMIGTTAGSHRFWSHKTFKAKLPLKLLLVCMQTLAGQNSIWEWVRDHRLHHKYSETNADPHNAKRGFFFAHMGWLMCRKHPAVIEMGKKIDVSDLEADSVIMFQKRFYKTLVLKFFLISTLIPVLAWNEKFIVAWNVAVVLRYCYSLHSTWLVNSAAHLWGNKPYDRNINPAENKFVSAFALGEGWHNFHHAFPCDYKTSELGSYTLNMTTAFIDFMANIGWAYDLKTVSEKVIKDRIKRTGVKQVQ